MGTLFALGGARAAPRSWGVIITEECHRGHHCLARRGFGRGMAGWDGDGRPWLRSSSGISSSASSAHLLGGFVGGALFEAGT